MNLHRDAHRLYEEYDMFLKTNGIVSGLNNKHTLSQYTDVEGMERDILSSSKHGTRIHTMLKR